MNEFVLNDKNRHHSDYTLQNRSHHIESEACVTVVLWQI